MSKRMERTYEVNGEQTMCTHMYEYVWVVNCFSFSFTRTRVMCRRCGGQCVTMEIRSASERRAQLEIVVMTATVTMDGRMLGAWWRWNSCSLRARPYIYCLETPVYNYDNHILQKSWEKKKSPRKKWFLISNVIIRTFSHFSMNRKFHLALNNNWTAQTHTHRLTNCGTTCRCVPFLFWQNVIIIIVRRQFMVSITHFESKITHAISFL